MSAISVVALQAMHWVKSRRDAVDDLAKAMCTARGYDTSLRVAPDNLGPIHTPAGSMYAPGAAEKVTATALWRCWRPEAELAFDVLLSGTKLIAPEIED